MLVQGGPPAPSKTAPPNGVLPVIPLAERSCCDDHLNPPNTPRSSSATAAAMQACAPRWVRSATPMTTPCARASSPPSNASFSRGTASRRRPRRAMRSRSPSSRASTIRAAAIPRSDISHRSTTSAGITQPAVDPDAHQPAAVLAAVKDKPSGRPQEAAVLDRRCARRPHHRAGRDGRMAPPGAEPKNGSTQEGNMPSNQIA